MPALSPTMTQGNIVSWKKNVGDRVEPNDVLAEIETDKAVMSFESTEEGYLARILYPAGSENIPVGTTVAILAENKDSLKSFENYEAPQPTSTPSTPTPKPPPTPPTPESVPKPPESAPKPPESAPKPPESTPSPPQALHEQGTPPIPNQEGRIFATPLARATAEKLNVNLSQVTGTGPNLRVVNADVLEFNQQQQQQPREQQVIPSAIAYTDIPHSSIRKVIAARLTQSKQTIPHYYLTAEINVDKLLKLRAELNNRGKGEYKLSVNDFVVKAAALALRKVPEVNSSWTDTAIRRYHDVNINVAVNTPQGLLTPILHKVDTLGLQKIASTIAQLAEKAKNGKITAVESQVGTFTISNLGMFGVKHFAAVINPPQAAILAVGEIEKRVVVKEDKEGAKDPTFVVSNFILVTLSADHRAVDGAVGAQWLQAFNTYLEDPVNMLL